uniref:Uncharacterized protein n=1 Tax=Romanomermis culicivorax TaxID=13658 RepID=A0A915JKF3_ROMCU
MKNGITPQDAQKAIDHVFEKCINDLTPFSRTGNNKPELLYMRQILQIFKFFLRILKKFRIYKENFQTYKKITIATVELWKPLTNGNI